MLFSSIIVSTFPHYKFTEQEKINEMRRLRKVSCEDYISDGIVRQTMHGLGLAWSYFLIVGMFVVTTKKSYGCFQG